LYAISQINPLSIYLFKAVEIGGSRAPNKRSAINSDVSEDTFTEEKATDRPDRARQNGTSTDAGE
jgi:hypothetical protein